MDSYGQPNQNPPIKSSYVDDYAPPAASPSAPVAASTAPFSQTAAPITPPPFTPPASVASTPLSVASKPASESDTKDIPEEDPEDISQVLEDQNIFTMLGLDHVSDQDKESFLNELQDVIWEDFVENDLKLLLTQEEYGQAQAILAKPFPSEEEKQGALIESIEKQIPDLENIMLEKALELKEEMFRERVKEMAQRFQGQPDELAQVKKVEESIAAAQWKSATDLLNTL